MVTNTRIKTNVFLRLLCGVNQYLKSRFFREIFDLDLLGFAAVPHVGCFSVSVKRKIDFLLYILGNQQKSSEMPAPTNGGGGIMAEKS